MRAINNHAEPGRLTLERSCDRARIAAAKPGHGVEQMGKARKSLCHGGTRLLVGCQGMAETDPHASVGKRPNEARRCPLGCERHNGDRSARLGEEGEVVAARGADVVHRMYAR